MVDRFLYPSERTEGQDDNEKEKNSIVLRNRRPRPRTVPTA